MSFAFSPAIVSAMLCAGLHAQQQLLVVIADDFDAATATLQRYESGTDRYTKIGDPVTVNLGRNGLGWGIGAETVTHETDEPVKREGDGKAPAGIFALSHRFGYAPASEGRMPYIHATKETICIDDTGHEGYNTITRLEGKHPPKSFEWMRREDGLYEIGVTVDHNPQGIAEAGSCIFLHLEKGAGMPTSGCTSMAQGALKKIIKWLDAGKQPLLVQVPRSYCNTIEKRFRGVECEE